MTYKYNPHIHLKIWLSNNPNVFINLENQIRLVEMRERNPSDTIHLVFDSTLLTPKSIADLTEFCIENNIIPFDALVIQDQLKSDNERKLYQFYQDEIYNLKSGGNLAVASDILRWLSPIYSLGTYTDFDFPIDTVTLAPNLTVETPIVLNIGSLKMGKKEFILANNDYVAVVDEAAAQEKICRIQAGILKKLAKYDTDFIEKTESELSHDSFLNRHLLKFMRNRSESLYIAKSKGVNPENRADSSLKIRGYINEVMTDTTKFLDFNKISSQEPREMVLKRLRRELKKQLNPIKFLFFNKEFMLTKRILEQNDEKFLTYLMKKEHDLYVKSIVVCTTGPIEISNALFEGYVVDATNFIEKVQPFSFNHYGLQKAFRSKNSLPLHENVLGMLKFLGVKDGELNDSSWLGSGRKLQTIRTKQLIARQNILASSVPVTILAIKNDIETHLSTTSKKNYKQLFRARNQARNETLQQVLACYNEEDNVFDIAEFKKIFVSIPPRKKFMVTKLITELDQLCHEAVLFGLAKNKKINLGSVLK